MSWEVKEMGKWDLTHSKLVSIELVSALHRMSSKWLCKWLLRVWCILENDKALKFPFIPAKFSSQDKTPTLI